MADTVGGVAAGFGDTISLGLTDWTRSQLGIGGGTIDPCSDSYRWGGFLGFVHAALSGAAGPGKAAGAGAAGKAARAGRTVDDFLPEAAKRLARAKAEYGDGAVLLARKGDIKQIDRMVREVGLNKEERRILHKEIAGMHLTIEEIQQIALEVAQQFPKGR